MSKYIFYGIGGNFKQALFDYPNLTDFAAALCDQSPLESVINGVDVVTPDHISCYEFEKIVISSTNYYEEIFNRLLQMGYSSQLITSLNKFIIKYLVTGELFSNKVRLEACTLCQLNCVKCPMRTNYNLDRTIKPVIGKGYLKFADFKKFVDKTPYIKKIELSNWGEVFLNPELSEILKYAYEKNISISMYNGVNFNTVSEEILELMVLCKVSFINISIDGASQETYSIYRRNGNYNKVIENIIKLNYYKQIHNSDFPVLQWQYIIFEHNEQEVLLAKQQAEKLNMKMFFKLQRDFGYVPKDPAFLHRVTGLEFLSIEEYNEHTNKDYLSLCTDMIYVPQINWDGRLLGCCRAIDCDFGVNVFEMGLQKALSSEEFVKSKKNIFLKDNEIYDLSENNPCKRCHIYKKMVITDNFYYKNQIRSDFV